MTGIILRARGLRVTYPAVRRESVAVAGTDFDLRAGEIVGMLGESGSGKSSVGLALLGLVRHPGRLAGSVEFGGRNLLALGDEELRQVRGRSIGLITQKPRQSLNPFLDVGTQIARTYRAHVPTDRRAAREHAVDLLRQVGINDPERRAHAYPHELSGGMAQRALISVALAARPQLLVADEPTSGLDVTIQAQFLDRMWQRARDDGTSILLITQDLGIVANYCDRVIVLEEGRIIADCPTVPFFDDPPDDYSRRILTLAHQRRAERRPGPAAARPAGVDGAAEHVRADSEEDGRPTPTRGRAATAPAGGPAPDAADVLRVEQLNKAFTLDGGARLQAVSSVSLRVRRGRSLGLVGESGSGKTTVGRMVLRLLDADSGTVHFAGELISSLDPARFRPYRARLQVVFQDPFDSLNPRWTIARTLREPLDLHTRSSARDKASRIAELLRLVGLPPAVATAYPRDLSAGNQQRACLARALATDPEFLILDEPTSALPPAARVEMIALLRDLQQRLGLSFVLISHDLSTVRELCQDVAVMYLSQVVEQGTAEQIFDSPQHPYTRALLGSVLFHDPRRRRVDRAVNEDLRGEIPSPVNLPTGCYLAGRCPHVRPRCTAEAQQLLPLPGDRGVRCWRAAAGELPTTDPRQLEPAQ